MHDHEPCGVTGCCGLVVSTQGVCAVHEQARRLASVMAGERCVDCHRLLQAGDWVTAESAYLAMRHCVCPPKAVGPYRKVDRPKPLFDAAESAPDVT